MKVEKLNLANSIKEFERAKQLMPGGGPPTRRPSFFVPGEYPIFFEEGKGARVKDVDGNEYIDYMCAYGPIIIGYRESEIDEAVIKQIREKGFCFSLGQTYENRLAEKLKELIPCAEMSLFVKTGSDGTTASIRLARAHTKRTKIVRCGYHGWHDWCVKGKGGIPKKLYEDVYEFEYNTLESLQELLKVHGHETAGVIMTPFGHPLDQSLQEPKPGFLEGVKELAHQYGAVLIFDEVRTGFRISMGGAQKYYGVTPDIAVFGKGMANGYAIGVVTGKEEIMTNAGSEVYVSSTFFPNSLGYIAALKTIEFMEKNNVLEAVWEKGRYLMNGIKRAIERYDAGGEISGIPPMMFISFKNEGEKSSEEKRIDFYTQMIRRGVFIHPFHHGYVCYRHTQEDLDYTIRAVEESLEYLKNKYPGIRNL